MHNPSFFLEIQGEFAMPGAVSQLLLCGTLSQAKKCFI